MARGLQHVADELLATAPPRPGSDGRPTTQPAVTGRQRDGHRWAGGRLTQCAKRALSSRGAGSSVLRGDCLRTHPGGDGGGPPWVRGGARRGLPSTGVGEARHTSCTSILCTYHASPARRRRDDRADDEPVAGRARRLATRDRPRRRQASAHARRLGERFPCDVIPTSAPRGAHRRQARPTGKSGTTGERGAAREAGGGSPAGS